MHRRPGRHDRRRRRRPRRRPAAARTPATTTRSGCSTRRTGPRSPVCAPTSSRSPSPSPKGRASPSTATPVTWQKWHLRVGFTPREGLVLHQITYDDKGRRRPVVYRASLSEMVVPYGDPAPTHWNKNVFDEGEVGMGFSANSLTLGCDCLGHIHYFDAVVNNSDGAAVGDPERDLHARGGLRDRAGSTPTSAPARSRSAAPAGWSSRASPPSATTSTASSGTSTPTATIEYEVKLTGVLTTGAMPSRATQPRHGVAGRAGPLRPEPPALLQRAAGHGGRRRAEHRLRGRLRARRARWGGQPAPQRLGRQADAARDREGRRRGTLGPETARYWKIANRGVVNELGQEVACKLDARPHRTADVPARARRSTTGHGSASTSCG